MFEKTVVYIDGKKELSKADFELDGLHRQPLRIELGQTFLPSLNKAKEEFDAGVEKIEKEFKEKLDKLISQKEDKIKRLAVRCGKLARKFLKNKEVPKEEPRENPA